MVKKWTYIFTWQNFIRILSTYLLAEFVFKQQVRLDFVIIYNYTKQR